MDSFHDLHYPIMTRNESMPTSMMESYYVPIGLHLEHDEEDDPTPYETDRCSYKDSYMIDNRIFNTFLVLAVVDEDKKRSTKYLRKTKKRSSK